MRRLVLVVGGLLASGVAAHVGAQDANIMLPAARVEALLREGPIKPVANEGSRYHGDRTEHVLLSFDDTTTFFDKHGNKALVNMGRIIAGLQPGDQCLPPPFRHARENGFLESITKCLPDTPVEICWPYVMFSES